MIKDRLLICRPVEGNYIKGFASISKKERDALKCGSIVEVVIKDRSGKRPDMCLNPTLVLEQLEWYRYRQKLTKYIRFILRFNFIQVEKLQSDPEIVEL